MPFDEQASEERDVGFPLAGDSFLPHRRARRMQRSSGRTKFGFGDQKSARFPDGSPGPLEDLFVYGSPFYVCGPLFLYFRLKVFKRMQKNIASKNILLLKIWFCM